jgi:hypothetical protein
MESMFISSWPYPLLPQLLVTSWVAVLFLQSGLDKVLHYRGNQAYLTEHFRNSPLHGTVPLLMPLITMLETLAGLTAAAGLFFLLQGNPVVAFFGQALGALALLCLFSGQRLAQDYAGAATLVPYFLLTLAGMYLCK